LSPTKGFQLTIGLPVYNAMPYLREAVESLLTQTVRNFEILAIVDGATDDSHDYLQSVRDARLKIVVQPNAGLTATLNRMLREVNTPWLVRQDADDVSYPTRIERSLEFIDRYPDAGMFYSLAEYYPRARSVGLFRSTRGTPDELRQLVQSGYLLSICHPGVVLNVEKTLAVGGYRSDMLVEDADLWWRMALAHDIHCISEPLVGFRQNLASVSSRNLERQWLRVLYVQYLLLSHLESRDPEPFATIESQLEKLFPRRDFKAKEHLRSLNMALAEKNYSKAGLAVINTITTSPTYLLRRLRDEFLPGVITNGVDPGLYRRRIAQFWPRASNSISERSPIRNDVVTS
jgi:glycosyltransferase involved in cell wall biosynthesis